jgi:sec-independent protein translocase protein TatB
VFGIEWTEYAVIAIVALIVIGPKELPAVLRAMGQWTTKIRRMAAEFQGQFQEALREAEMADLKKEVDDAARGFTSQFDDPLNFKEATKWEPQSDAAQPDAAKPDDIKPDDAAKPAAAPPESSPVTVDPAPDPHAAGGGDEEAFPVAGAPPATAQTSPPSLPSFAGGREESGGAKDAAPAPQVTPPAAQSLLPEGSSQRSDAGGVHS